MKKIYSSIAGLLLTASVWAQAPQKMSYQAIIRDGSNVLVTSTQVGIQISILQGSSSGIPVYVETHLPTTNLNGVVSLEIGGGTMVSGIFSGINWATGPYFLKTETDPDGTTGGLNYTIVGSSELLSVPYALFSETSGSSTDWHLLGNAGTNDGTDFIGTTDNVPLNFRVNNIGAGKIDNQLGNVFLGSASGVNTISTGNTAVGYFSFNTNTSGINNTALGANALQISTTGNSNTAIGGGTLSNNSTGSENVAIGQLALMNNTTGSQNTALGTNAFMTGTLTNTTIIGYGATATVSNTMGLGNTAITDVKTAGTYTAGTVTYPNTLGNAGDVLTLPISGGNAYWSAPSGGSSTNNWNINGNSATVDGLNFIGTTDNVPFNIRVNNQKAGRIDNMLNNAFFGYVAGNSNTTGFVNTAIGGNALRNNTTGEENTAIGGHALYSNTIGQQNTVAGAFAMQFNTTGSVNTAIGQAALNLNTSGSYNSALGFQTLLFNTTGTHNTASGYLSMNENTTGSQNAGYGSYALNSNITGFENTAVGYLALTNTTISSGNTALGANAGDYLVDNGSNNTFLGYNASALIPGLNNTTTLGYNAKVSINNAIVIGGTAGDAVTVGVGTTAPHSRMQVNGSFATTIVGTNSAYTLGIDDQIILVKNTTTVTLPSAFGIAGRMYTIKRLDPGNVATLAAIGAETIDGLATQTINTNYAGITVASDGNNWVIISRF